MKELMTTATLLFLITSATAFLVEPLWGLITLGAALASAATYFLYLHQSRNQGSGG